MVTAIWSVKGGVGVTSVAAMLAIACVERACDALVVDLCGEVPEVLGLDDAPPGPGLADWCELGRPDGEAMARIEAVARPGLHVVPRGPRRPSGQAAPLLQVLATSSRSVILDCGQVTEAGGSAVDDFRLDVVRDAPRSLLVVRECLLNLRAARRCPLIPNGVIIVKERNRQLGRRDVEQVTGAPVVAEVAFDPSISRSIDAGLLSARLPRGLLRVMSSVLHDAA